MATIAELMPYLEQGYMAHDSFRRAYLTPFTKDGKLQFEWKAYEGEGDWSGPDIHDRDYVLTWESDEWGILCDGKGGEYSEDHPEKIKQAIAEGLAYKSPEFSEQ